MELPPSNILEIPSGIRAAGMIVYSKIREANKDLPIIVYSAIRDKDIISIFSNDRNTIFVSKLSSPAMNEIIERINTILNVKDAPFAFVKTFIVHGHNDALKLELKNYLQNTLKLPEPIILHEQSNVGRTIIEKFENYACCSNLVFVLLTPDDIVVASDKTDDEKRRSRQNVIFEMGFFMGQLGRLSGRIILLYQGSLELPSDISGVMLIDVSDGIESAGEKIRKEIQNVLRS